jgi:mannose-6-phosphate isomerase-like protein (cupin superfamily)
MGDNETMHSSFELPALLNRHQENGAAWMPFLEAPSLLMGIYVVRDNDRDDHQPHAMDEVYHVLSGRGVLHVDGEDLPMQPGTVVFVPARRNHFFHSIEEELALLVFFSRGDTLKTPDPEISR